MNYEHVMHSEVIIHMVISIYEKGLHFIAMFNNTL